MARPVWTGSISFGLVNVGVGLYTATAKQDVSFHQFERGTNQRVRNKRVAEGTDREVDYEDIVKGYETGTGEHILVTQDELENVEPEITRSIAIDAFVELAVIDPIYFDRSYYLAPRGADNEHSYALLREAMNQAGLAGVARFVMRNKEYLASIRATGDVLVLNTLFFADEVREPHHVVGELPGQRDLPKRELNMAVKLIQELTTSWEPEQYHDTYRERVLELIEEKASGGEVTAPREEQPESNVVDLVSALQQSIERTRADRERGRSSRRRWKHDELTKQQLYDRAGELGIAGRSKMSKDELQEAVAKAS